MRHDALEIHRQLVIDEVRARDDQNLLEIAYIILRKRRED